ncbi:MAG: class 1 fructose-bisphosphatase, partial [Brachymonas sp.]|nr:class 1 fructose-bisphosphatase [Brachymonas sp.]
MQLLPHPLPHRYTLTQYLIDQRKRYPQASGDFNALMLDVALACKAISRAVAFGKLVSMPGEPTPIAGAATAVPAGDEGKAMSALTNECFTQMNSWGGHLAGMASEDLEAPFQIPNGQPRGKYLLLFDPLDGSSNIDVNGTVGSIFSVLRAPDEVIKSGRDVVAE